MALASPQRPARDTFKEHRSDMNDPVVLEIANELGVSSARVCLSWAAQRMNASGGYVVMATQSDRIRENLLAATTELLSKDQLARLCGDDEQPGIDANNRLIWGQVFLWPEADGDWRILWNDSQVFKTRADYAKFKEAFNAFEAVRNATVVPVPKDENAH